jgi:hypothetical protein
MIISVFLGATYLDIVSLLLEKDSGRKSSDASPDDDYFECIALRNSPLTIHVGS